MIIYKYELTPFEVTRLELPGISYALSAIEQRGKIQLYVNILDNPKFGGLRPRHFACFPTGNSEQFDGLRGWRVYGGIVGTVVVGDFVFHIFEVRQQ